MSTTTPTEATAQDEAQELREFEREIHAFFQEEKADDVPLESLLASIEHTYPQAPKPRPTPWWRGSLWGGMALAMASVAFLLILPDTNDSRLSISGRQAPQTNPTDLITRGGPGPTMHVIRKKEHKTQKRFTFSGEKFHTGDQIRLLIEWQRGGFVFVLHRDAKGTLTPLYPANKEQQGLVLPKGKKRHQLPGSLKVTATQDPKEEIWACFSTKPLPYKAVSRDIQAHAKKPASSRPFKSSTCRSLQIFVMDRTGDTQ